MNIFIYVLVLFVIISLAHGAPFRSKKGCVICGRKSDSRPFKNNPVAGKENICEAFNVRESAGGDKCSACDRALRRYKTTGVKAPKVSIPIHIACAVTYTDSYTLSTNEIHNITEIVT